MVAPGYEHDESASGPALGCSCPPTGFECKHVLCRHWFRLQTSTDRIVPVAPAGVNPHLAAIGGPDEYGVMGAGSDKTRPPAWFSETCPPPPYELLDRPREEEGAPPDLGVILCDGPNQGQGSGYRASIGGVGRGARAGHG